MTPFSEGTLMYVFAAVVVLAVIALSAFFLRSKDQ